MRPAAAAARATEPPILAPGARVVIRDETWIVRSHKPEASGGLAVHVTGTSELVRDREATFLTKLDEIQVLAPEDTALVMDGSSAHRNTRLTLEALLRRTPPTDEAIHLAHTAAIDAADYQLRPTTRALRLLRPRFLMADGVGLGKTIEVGALLTELIHRGRGRRILVVCMKSILAQFQEELWARFTIPLVRLDSVGIRRAAAKIPSSMNPFHVFDRIIISLDTLKSPRYARYLENCRFDAIVIDECQNVAMRTKTHHGAASQRYRLARLLAKQCDALILTSATPHDGSAKSFASIVRLLEPTAIADDENFTADEVRPFVQRYFKKDVAFQLSAVFPERETEHRHIAASPAERAVFDALGEATFQTMDRRRRADASLFADDPRLRKGGTLFRTTLLKAFLSSPEALASTLQERLRHQAVRPDPSPPRDAAADAAAHADRATLEHLADLTDAAGPIARTPKYAALLERVRSIIEGDAPDRPRRVVVFAERIDTLEALREALAKDLKLSLAPRTSRSRSSKVDPIEIFHGGLDDTSQMDVVKSFGSADSPIRVLLASDAAAEGINLHFHCADLVHYDLPWSLITLVQRNGRIDRYGQTSTPRIHYLLTRTEDAAHAGDLRILERLVQKEEQVQRNLGDPATLMHLFDADAEAEVIAAAAQGDIAPEEALPDEPVDDADFFFELFGGQTDDVEVLKRERPSLFEDDLDYARSALDVVAEAHETEPTDLATWSDTHKGFTLYPTTDLRRRYEHLPSELIRPSKNLRLTSDRDLVKRSIELARQAQDEWPEWELFWSNHPVCGWLDDQVLSALGRHEAWVVPLARGIAPDDALFLFQGVLSNRASLPILVDWFAIPFRGGAPGAPVTLDALLERTGFDKGGVNHGVGEVPVALADLLRPAVEAAEAHMAKLRAERAAAISSDVRDGQREVGAWRDASLAVLERAELTAAGGGTGAAPAPLRKRLDAERAEIEAIYEERKQFVDRLRTDAAPYLRLAAVFCRPDFR